MLTLAILTAGCVPSNSKDAVDADADTDADADADADSDADSDADADADSDSDADTDADYDIPDPGNGNGNCQDDEPNDTPNEAVPCGTVGVDFGTSGSPYINGARIGDADVADYYVFVTDSRVETLHTFGYWRADSDVMDFVLYHVIDDGTAIEEVARYETDNTGGENENFDEIPVEGGEVYLLEILPVEGGSYDL